MIPTWITVALTILWIIWAYVEITGYLAYRQHNKSAIMVRLHGRMSYGTLSFSISVLFIVLTVFGLSYLIMGD